MNKFQLSIQERLDQESNRGKTPSLSAKPVKGETTASELASSLNIETYLTPQIRRKAKNKTFYLDEDVIDAVRSVAKEKGVTDSKLVGDILRYVMGL